MKAKRKSIESSRGKKALRALLIIACIIFLSTVVLIIYMNSKLDLVSYISNPVVNQSKELTESRDRNTINILVLGTDKKVEGTNDTGRSDSTTLCSCNLLTGKIKVVSFERGIPIYIEDNNEYDLLTHVYHYLGALGMVEAIKKNFDVDIDGFIQVDFDTFPLIVNAIGGVDIELTQQEADAMNGVGAKPSNVYTEAEMHEGVNHLNGHDTLQYCRLRSLDDNFARQQRQRNTIEAILRQLRRITIFQLNEAVNELLPLINTNLPKNSIIKLLINSPRFLSAKMQQLQVPEKEYSSSYTMDIFSYDTEKQRIREFLDD